MQPEELCEGKFSRILWDGKSRTIGLDWKETTSTMTSEEFKAELNAFAGYVEEKKPLGIRVDVTKFHHKMTPDMQRWRVQYISSRYNAAGVQRFVFLFPMDLKFPPMPETCEGEAFRTRAFDSQEQVNAWLTRGE
jgi:hypothetical protein